MNTNTKNSKNYQQDFTKFSEDEQARLVNECSVVLKDFTERNGVGLIALLTILSITQDAIEHAVADVLLDKSMLDFVMKKGDPEKLKAFFEAGNDNTPDGPVTEELAPGIYGVRGTPAQQEAFRKMCEVELAQGLCPCPECSQQRAAEAKENNSLN